MFNELYIIKKTKYWRTPIPAGLFLPIVFILIPVIAFYPVYLEYRNWNIEDLIPMIVIVIFLVYWFYSLLEAIKLKKVKNYKYNWWWIVRQAKVTSIEKIRADKGGRWSSTYLYYFEAENSNIIYYSNWCAKWNLFWTSVSDLQLAYATYWFIFDINQTQKIDVLKKIDESIAEKEYEIENSWLFSKGTKWRELSILKKNRKIIEEWYISPYWQIDDKKVSVWDMVDVYMDPNNPELYRVDTDFLF